MADYNYTEATDTLAKQKASNAALLASQAGQESDYLNRYKTAIGGQETSSAMAKRIGAELNLPTLSENAFNLNRTVRELPQTYSAATRGFDVNANQLSRIIGQKTAELTPALTTANEAVANANQALATQMGYQLSDQEKQLLPFTTEKELLTNKLARETSMYTAENENELNTIIQKIASGIQISEAEKNRAMQLAAQEQTYNLEKEKLNQPSWQEITIGGNKYRINMATGEKQLLGSATAPSTGGTSEDILKWLQGNQTTPQTTKQTTNTTTTSSFVPDTKTTPSGNISLTPSVLDYIQTGNKGLDLSKNVDLSNITGNKKTGLYLAN